MSSEYKYYVRQQYHPFRRMLVWNRNYYCIRIHNETRAVEFIRYDLSIDKVTIVEECMLPYNEMIEIDDIFDGYTYCKEDFIDGEDCSK